MLLLAVARAQAQNELVDVAPLARIKLSGSVTSVRFTPTGESVIAGTADGRVVLAEARTGGITREWKVGGRISAVAVAADGLWFAASSGDNVVLINPAQAATRSVRAGDAVTSLASAPGGGMLAAGTRGGQAVLIDARDGTVIGRLRDGHKKSVQALVFSRGGETLLSVGADRQVVYWDVKKLERLRQIGETEPTLVSASSTPAGDLLLIGTEAALLSSFGSADAMRDVRYHTSMKVYDVATGAPQKVIDLEGRSPAALGATPDCRYGAVALRGTRGSALALYDLERGVSVVDRPLDSKPTVVAVSPTGRVIAVGEEDGSLVFLAVSGVQPRPRCVADLRGTKFAITGPRTPLVKPSRRVRFAVLDLDDNGVGAEVSRAIADLLTTRLGLNPGIRLVERRRIAAILQEQNLQHSGRTDPQEAIRLARVLNVQKVLMGAVAKLGTTMTITVQMVDVETAAIDGSREVQCRACELEDLTQAVSELAQTVIAEPDAAVLNFPDPPEIHLDYPLGDREVTGSSVVVRGTILYSKPLEGVELLVNGRALDASRLLDRSGGKLTRLSDGTTSFGFVQEVPLDQVSNTIAVRAVGADGNDEQRYVTVRRAATSSRTGAQVVTPSVAPPGIAFDELATALRSHVPTVRLTSLVSRYGISFDLAAAETRLRQLGADASLLRVLAVAKRSAPPPP